ncbi:hypothetical protein [Nocardioides flavus (ex Wang et al. 2016)]|nr:hypothetical protein [Nocardioides flavus (ex Wang et al. 2016)]
MTWRGVVEPDYFQFYARRGDAAMPDVSLETYERRLWTDGRFVVVSTFRKYGTTPVSVDVVAEEPPGPGEEWQHIAEVSLEGSEPLEVLSWEVDEGPRSLHEVPAGPLRLRVHWGGLVAGLPEGMTSQGRSEEHLALVVWPAPTAPFVALREWDGWPW